jgi:capsular polysaccharide biosynthesis protein
VGKNPDDAWYQAEVPTRNLMVTELRRLKRRSQARWWVVVLVTIGLTGAIVLRLARKPAIYKARVILAVTESSMTNQEPMPAQDLQDYIVTVLLADVRLIPIIEEKNLFPKRRLLGNEFAIEQLREQFSVDVYHNYFLYGRGWNADPRSVRIAIGYTSNDAEGSFEMANRLAQTIIDAENERRRDDAQFALSQIRGMQRRAEQQLTDHSARLTQTMIEEARAESTDDTATALRLRLEGAELNRQLIRDRELVESITSVATAAGLGAAAEQVQLGLDFQIVDERHPRVDEEGKSLMLTTVAVVAFLLLLPAVAIVVGAFDTRIHDLDDVSRLGIPVVGHVPPFAGDDVGSLAKRGKPPA